MGEGNVNTAALTGGGAEGAGTVTEYTYEQGGSGYLTSTKLGTASPEDSTADADPRYLYSSSQFTDDKNRTASVSDTAGNTVTYEYNNKDSLQQR